MKVHQLELDLFLCVFILGTLPGPYGGRERDVRNWNWPRKGCSEIVMFSGSAEKSPSWTFWKGNWWLAAKKLSWEIKFLKRNLMLDFASCHMGRRTALFVQLFFNYYFKARETERFTLDTSYDPSVSCSFSPSLPMILQAHSIYLSTGRLKLRLTPSPQNSP